MIDYGRCISVEISQDEKEWIESFAEAIARRHAGIGDDQPIDTDKTALDCDYQGYAGEFAYCKVFGQEFDFNINRKREWDLKIKDGIPVDVKTPFDRSWEFGHVWVPCWMKDTENQIYAFAKLQRVAQANDVVYLVGYVQRDDLFQDKNMASRKNKPEIKDYRFPARDLRPITDLL